MSKHPRWGVFKNGELQREFRTPWSIHPYVAERATGTVVWLTWDYNTTCEGFDADDNDWLVQALGKHHNTYEVTSDKDIYTSAVRAHSKGIQYYPPPWRNP